MVRQILCLTANGRRSPTLTSGDPRGARALIKELGCPPNTRIPTPIVSMKDNQEGLLIFPKKSHSHWNYSQTHPVQCGLPRKPAPAWEETKSLPPKLKVSV